MATLYSKASADFMALGTFNTLANGTGADTIPTAADDLILQNGHNVTIGTTTAVAKTITAQSGSTLTHSTAANSKLVMSGAVTFQSGSTHTCNLSSVPSITTDIQSNGTAGTANCIWTYDDGANFTLKGAPRTRWTTLTAAVTGGVSTSCSVANSSGWQTGDLLIFEDTQPYVNSSTFKIDVLNSSGSPTGFAAALTYDHASGGTVGNFSSNVRFQPVTVTDVFFELRCLSNGFGAYIPCSRSVQDVLFYNVLLRLSGSADSGAYSYIGSNAHYQSNSNALLVNTNVLSPTKGLSYNDSALYTTFNTPVIIGGSGGGGGLSFSNLCIFRADWGMQALSPGMAFSGLRASHLGTVSPGLSPGYAVVGMRLDDSYFNNSEGPLFFTGEMALTRCQIGTKFGATHRAAGGDYRWGGFCKIDMTDCEFQTSGLWDGSPDGNLGSEFDTLIDGSYLRFRNKNRDVSVQEYYSPRGAVFRDNSEKNRSTSAMKFRPRALGKDLQKTVSIPCANGATVRVVGYCKASTAFYNGGGSNWTPPTVSLSGTINGVTLTPPALFTSTYNGGVGGFEFFDISITNSSGADGNVTLTFTANPKSVITGDVYFDGVPTSDEFITKARHYGFVFDQTSPNVSGVSAVSGSSAWSASGSGAASLTAETTAIGITGVTIPSPSSSASAIVLTASKTFQQVYDYTQAWACTTANLGYAVPCSAPVAGSLIAAANITTTGCSLTGSGSIAMGAYTLTSEFTAGGYAFTYTGGTYSQATAGAPVFTGGTLYMPAQGAITVVYTFTGNTMTVNFNPSANGANYNLSSGTFTGTITLTNTSGRNCTVQLPTGTTVSNSTSGANLITVVSPSIYQSVTITGAVAGSRIQLYDTTHSVELYNGTPTFPYTWTDPTPAASTRAIRLRVAYQSTVTAKNFIDVNIGTCATSGAGKDISYLVAQKNDFAYNLYAINGSTVTGIAISVGPNRCTFTVTGDRTNPEIYAYQVYWQFTSVGIAQETAFIESPTGVDFIYTDFKWKNNGGSTITISSGYPVDSVTGLSSTLIDTTGGNICVAPNHVVLATTGSGPLTTAQAAQLTAIEGATVGNSPVAGVSHTSPR
jgi:hypothetical protein